MRPGRSLRLRLDHRASQSACQGSSRTKFRTDVRNPPHSRLRTHSRSLVLRRPPHSPRWSPPLELVSPVIGALPRWGALPVTNVVPGHPLGRRTDGRIFTNTLAVEAHSTGC